MSGSLKRNINSTAMKVTRTWRRWRCAAVSRRGEEAPGGGVQTARGHRSVTAGPTCCPENTPRVCLLPGNTRAQRDCGKWLPQHGRHVQDKWGAGCCQHLGKYKAWKYQGHLQQTIWHFTVLSSSLMRSGLLRFAGIAKLAGLRLLFPHS